MRIGRHFIISGQVQGVFFRAGTEQQAKALELTGWVRNLANGDVEVMACGKAEQVDQLHRWLQHGSDAAEVTALTANDVPLQLFDEFSIKYDQE
ncbi:MAG: acylphosphatase [Gammaproteobacteria bacterium]|nr:acylphosphatase [Gammaproteobacteria bacterium]MCP4475667.1 acylphosphatase [Gammaproteobacteria bacterium]